MIEVGELLWWQFPFVVSGCDCSRLFFESVLYCSPFIPWTEKLGFYPSPCDLLVTLLLFHVRFQVLICCFGYYELTTKAAPFIWRRTVGLLSVKIVSGWWTWALAVSEYLSCHLINLEGPFSWNRLFGPSFHDRVGCCLASGSFDDISDSLMDSSIT